MADSKTEQAYRLGSVHRYSGREPIDLENDSARLMDELGETSPTTIANTGAREAMCDAYLDGWHDANSALGGWEGTSA